MRILSIEDNAADQEVIRYLLAEKSDQHSISFFFDGVQALRAIDQMKPDQLPQIILLDYNLPVMTGDEVLKEIRKRDLLQNVPVAILTTSPYHEDILSNYPAKLNAYFVKPHTLGEFSSVLDEIIDFCQGTEI